MINFEKYKDTLIELYNSSNDIGIAISNGKPCRCDLYCSGCDLKEADYYYFACRTELIRWLFKEYEEEGEKE